MKKPRVVVPGVIVGVVLLAVVVVYAVFLPKAHGDKALSLPDKLPDGYVAADLRSAYDKISGVTDAEKLAYATQQVDSKKYASKAFKSVDVDGITRSYLTADGQRFVTVQLMRADGGAISPYLFTDPASAESGTQLDHYLKVGGAVCIETGTADGTGKVAQSVIECQKSADGLTLQLTTQAPVKTVAKLIKALWAEVA